MLEQIDHVNLVVADLPLMENFYTRVLGLHVSKRVRISGEWIEKVVGISGVIGDVVYLELPAGPRIELIHYLHPQGAKPQRPGDANTHGLRHLAFRVTDIDAAVRSMTDAGAKFLGDVQRVPDTQVSYAGGVRKRLIYLHDPEGNLLELCEYKS